MKIITEAVIRDLHGFTESRYSENHIAKPFFYEGISPTRERIDRIMNFVSLLPESLGETQRAALMYQIVCRMVSYDYDSSNDKRYSYLQALEDSKAVCMGIAELYQILCIACGIPAEIVIGCSTDSDRDDVYHAWVQLKLPDKNGKRAWYMADPTWDLSQGCCPMNYFLRGDDYFSDHGHYWLREEYHSCPGDYPEITPFDDGVMEQVIDIFRQQVCPDRKNIQ